MILLPPPKGRILSFAKTENAKDVAHPACHVLHDTYVQVLTPCVDVHVGPGHEISENVKGIWGVERIAKRGTESELAFMEAT